MPTIVLIEHDTACGILAGIFEPGPYTVTPEAITELNPSGKAPQTQKYWLKPNDVVGAVTRMYLAARQALSEMPEQAAPNLQPGQRTQQMKARDDANARLQELKRQLYDILRFRDAIEKANRAGFRLIYTPPEPPATGRRSSK